MGSSEEMKKLQVQFLTIFGRWANFGTEVEETKLDLPHVVHLLQSVGFNIRRIDSQSPSGLAQLPDGQIGTRVIVSCGHSGQRCFLDLPSNQEECKCQTVEADNSFWEVVAKDNSLVDSGSDLITPLSKEMKTLVKNVLNLLMHLIKGISAEEEDLYQVSSTLSNTTSSPVVSNAKRLSGYINELMYPAIILSSPKNLSSARHSMIDLNTNGKDNDSREFQLHPLTPTESNISLERNKSSPNLNVDSKDNTPVNSGSVSKLERAIELIQQFIVDLPGDKAAKTPPPAQTTYAIDKVKSVSSPNLSAKKTRPSPRFRTSSVSAKPTAAVAGRLSLKKADTPGSQRRLSNAAEARTSGQKPKLNTKPKPNSLYAHVKSTIPKPSTSWKKS